tara:strand:- start:1106 stop:1312 length:207 start_codon:yes stop_codon:yes gene_type:complete
MQKKVIFRGNKSPSGKNTNVEYVVWETELKSLEESGMFDIEYLDVEKKETKKKEKKKAKIKEKKSEEK